MSLDAQHQFSAAERDTIYANIALRRDIRHFVPGGRVEEAQLQRMLNAAHQAPSVGLMQPWRFMRLRNTQRRAQIQALVELERQRTAAALDARAAEFLRLKVEGIADCAELLLVSLAADDGTVFGRRSMPREMALCSAACAVQNLWLAARAENLGLGWVSMFEPQALAELLHLPAGSMPLGLLCLGPVATFYERPMLDELGWRQARPLADMLMDEPPCQED
ncbi:5,6-dimethylbenzimidazole synthase [Paucibacter oligotrophus]|uniref:5,6-dimethylbenzimidazole synthase n=1 Tax=Roseateles oligotrophus TaxID=1769250 RepID=A0A840LFK8_9BURK|nr:5,6-dimethylbenzimidazole synthase [Roseateles oligotrophus]MBB4845785.1 5,6-dimethylbenzimidazole synthase [Roseateles oligotrophus]